MSKEYPIGPAESVKQNSHHLRGSIIEELTLERPDFSKETVQILKFHGTYQQSDRDQRRAGLPPEFGSMVRLSIPGGALTAEQYLQLDRLADEAGDGGLRITSRQDIQFHRVGKTEAAAADPHPECEPPDHAGRLRRCGAQRGVLPRAFRRQRENPRPAARGGPWQGTETLDAGLLRDLAGR